MKPIPVIAVFDIGKTNKKLFLLDEGYRIVFEKSAVLPETLDEDGTGCEDISLLRLFVFDALLEVLLLKNYEIKAVNFSAYGASLVYIDKAGRALAPLYSYLKAYPDPLRQQFDKNYGLQEDFCLRTAAPFQGSLNSGFQLYRLKYERPELFTKVRYALHLPQYLSFLLTGQAGTDITSLGCHTALRDFTTNQYHQWVQQEYLTDKLAPIIPSDAALPHIVPGSTVKVGIGLHDSSAALIPYLISFKEPFVLISTGTWCVSLNPFDNTPLSTAELRDNGLCYLQFNGAAVKASRLFLGYWYEQQVARLAAHYGTHAARYHNLPYNPSLGTALMQNPPVLSANPDLNRLDFDSKDLSLFKDDAEAFHTLVYEVVARQAASTRLVLNGSRTCQLFADGGFGKNKVYMHLLAAAFPGLKVYAASVAQASALGAALAIHSAWHSGPVPGDLVQLKKYSVDETVAS